MKPRDSRLFLLAAASIVSMCWPPAPAWCQLDDFELAPSVEKTRIPPRLKQTQFGRQAVTPEDIKKVEALRLDIERLYQTKSFEEAEPVYRQYVSLLGKIAPSDGKFASALQHYADLLRKLHKEAEAGAADAQATAILTKAETAGIAYGFKDYRLGMSLDDFAKLIPPGGDAKKVKGVCSCDAGQNVEATTPADKNAKVIQCGFWRLEPNGVVTVPYSMTVANIECSPDFRFVEQDGVYRLYEINIVVYSSNYEPIKAALVGKYGDPTSQEVEKMRTEMGNNFPLTNLFWDNGISKIRLSNADGTNTGRAKLRYIHRQLFLAYAKRINDAKDSPNKEATTDL